MNKANYIFDLVNKKDKETRYVLTTSAGILSGNVEFPEYDCLHQDFSAFDMVMLKNGFLQQGNDKIGLDDTYVFLDSVVAISPAAAEL